MEAFIFLFKERKKLKRNNYIIYMQKAEYKFDANLLKLSRSKDIEIAKKEWREIFREEREERNGLCICQHTLKNIIYMYNIFTKYTISVGTGCCKKFKLKTVGIDNNILKNVLSEMISAGEYKIIDDVLEYTCDIQTQMIKYIMKEYKYFYCEELLTDVKMLIDNYGLSYLQSVYDELISRREHERIEREKEREEREKEREEREKEREEREKEREERIRKIHERIESERKNKEREKIKKEEEEKERIKLEEENIPLPTIEYSDFSWKKKYGADGKVYWYDHSKRISTYTNPKNCNCGIAKINICACKTPKYKLIKLSNNLFCESCNTWKCRCV